MTQPTLPTYLRVVVTTRCPMACDYCHAEGDRVQRPDALTPDARLTLIDALVQGGVRKVKLLGGEPLLDRSLPHLIRALRSRHPDLDLSIITSGAVPTATIDDAFDAGLSRMNLSIHGWGPAAFARRSRTPMHRVLRDAALEHLLTLGRPLKLNYVWGSDDDSPDLAALLDHAAALPVVVNVLDDLGRDLGPDDVIATVTRLRGPALTSWTEPDPDSLPTLRLRWSDGLTVEVKDQRLGEVAPWSTCATCPKRAACKEGIHALRLTHTGALRPCMDRDDLDLDLRPALAGGPAAVEEAVHAWLEALTPQRRAALALR